MLKPQRVLFSLHEVDAHHQWKGILRIRQSPCSLFFSEGGGGGGLTSLKQSYNCTARDNINTICIVYYCASLARNGERG